MPLNLIHSFMPSGNSKEDIEEYTGTLDCIYEVLQNRSVPVLILGDMNESFNRKTPCQRDILLMRFCKELQLSPLGDIEMPTFHHTNGISNSRIDHILMREQHSSLVRSVQVEARDPVNTSTHDPLLVSFTIMAGPPSNRCESPQHHRNILCRVPWNKVNLDQYAVETEKNLIAFAHVTDDNTPVEVQVERLNQILYETSKECANVKNGRCKNRKNPWDPNIKPLVQTSKDANVKWKLAGKLTDPADPT